MPMKNPPHPGGLIEDILREAKLTTAQAAKIMGITRQQLHKVIKCQSIITPEMAVRLEKAFGGTANIWVRMQAAYDLTQARQKLGDLQIARVPV